MTAPDGSHEVYTFDEKNDLRQVTTPQTTVGFGYDPDGHRVYRTEGGNVTWFVFDGLSCVMELGADKKPTAVMVPGVSKTRLDLPTPLTEFYLYDGLGSVVQLTDSLGNLTQEYQYEPFGLVQDNGTDRHNRYRFAGLAHEDALGLIYMNARWYDPNAGRFLSRDPVVGSFQEPQRLNPYLYVNNNPINYLDLTGLTDWWTVAQGVSAIVAGGAAATAAVLALPVAAPAIIATGAGAGGIAYAWSGAIAATSAIAGVVNILRGTQDQAPVDLVGQAITARAGPNAADAYKAYSMLRDAADALSGNPAKAIAGTAGAAEGIIDYLSPQDSIPYQGTRSGPISDGPNPTPTAANGGTTQSTGQSMPGSSSDSSPEDAPEDVQSE